MMGMLEIEAFEVDWEGFEYLLEAHHDHLIHRYSISPIILYVVLSFATCVFLWLFLLPDPSTVLFCLCGFSLTISARSG